MDFAGYIEVPIYNDNNEIVHYQMEMTWKEGK